MLFFSLSICPSLLPPTAATKSMYPLPGQTKRGGLLLLRLGTIVIAITIIISGARSHPGGAQAKSFAFSH